MIKTAVSDIGQSSSLLYATMHLHKYISALVIASTAICASIAMAETIIETDHPTISLREIPSEIDELRARINDIDSHLTDSRIENFITFEFVSEQITPDIVSACGNANKFNDFFSSHGFLPYDLSIAERGLLGDCMKGVFQFADNKLGFAAPGLNRRFDQHYVDIGIDLGYECGYRSQRAFSLFSLAVWLIHPQDIQRHSKFRCLGDLSYSEGTYSQETIEFGVTRIADELLFYKYAFGNWADAMRYVQYTHLVSENRRYETCLYLHENPYEDDELNKSLNLDNDCQDFIFE